MVSEVFNNRNNLLNFVNKCIDERKQTTIISEHIVIVREHDGRTSCYLTKDLKENPDNILDSNMLSDGYYLDRFNHMRDLLDKIFVKKLNKLKRIQDEHNIIKREDLPAGSVRCMLGEVYGDMVGLPVGSRNRLNERWLNKYDEDLGLSFALVRSDKVESHYIEESVDTYIDNYIEEFQKYYITNNQDIDIYPIKNVIFYEILDLTEERFTLYGPEQIKIVASYISHMFMREAVRGVLKLEDVEELEPSFTRCIDKMKDMMKYSNTLIPYLSLLGDVDNLLVDLIESD